MEFLEMFGFSPKLRNCLLFFHDVLNCNRFRSHNTYWFWSVSSQTGGLVGKKGLWRDCLHEFHMLIFLILRVS